MAGCNRHSNPVEIDDQGNLIRTAQDFSQTYPWGSSWFLDSASTTWIPPVPEPGPGLPPIPGMIATYDYGLGASPLLTATVKSEPGGPGSKIVLRLDDITLGSSPDFEEQFAAPPGMSGLQDAFCRYPTVEVTYSRLPYTKANWLTVYVVWSQLSLNGDPPDPPEQNWDLYGMLFQFQVISFGIDFANPTLQYGPYPLYTTNSEGLDDELQPDLALMQNGDLLLVYMESADESFTSADLVAVRFDYDELKPHLPPVLLEPYKVVVAPGLWPYQRNMAPSVDVGLVNSIDTENNYTAVCVWFQEVLPDIDPEPNPYHVWFATWDASDDQSGVTSDLITSGGDDNANALPKVDIAPPTPFVTPGDDPLRQAVVTWTHCTYWITGTDPDYVKHFSDPRIQMTVLQFPIGNILEIPGAYGIAPDIACYERHHPDQDQWFGLSYYEGDTGGEMPAWDWDRTRINSYSYDDQFTISYHFYGTVEQQPAYWGLESPFTGSSLCLRNPSVPDFGNPPEPIFDIFGIAKIQGDSQWTTVWVGDGTIYQ